MAVSWLHRGPVTSSVIIGASRLSQISECVKAADAAPFSQEELWKIDGIAPLQ
jgi:L-glyceraldehyde 3-phosphate reductase